jgi:GGDEF domain-containing protein
MKKWAPLYFPAGLFLLLVCVFALSSVGVGWPGYDLFRALPYVLLAASLFLGYFFAQSRVSFVSLLLAAVISQLEYSVFTRGALPRGEAVVFFSSLYVPVLLALFYHLGERGVFNLHGVVRLAIVLSVVAAIFLFPLSQRLDVAVARTRLALFRPVADGLPIPWSGLGAFVLSLPFFLFRKPHESPLLGPTLALALLFVFGMLNFRSVLWQPGQEHAILISFASGAGATLIWAVMETTWRNAYLDELTELPGRRALKNHLARLGADYTLGVLDVDHFKRINDRHGHDTGDEVLRYIASHLRQVRAGQAYRYGGEEFVIVSEGDDHDRIVEALDLLRLAIQEREFVVRSVSRPRRKPAALPGLMDGTPARSDDAAGSGSSNKIIRITVSIGAARRDGKNGTPMEVLAAADRALYRAKKGGRNRVVAGR